MNNPSLLIPAYNPSETLINLTEELLSLNTFDIIIVDDGSNAESKKFFQQLRELKNNRLHVIEHPVNLGKGAAIKTGLVYHWSVLTQNKGIITADADGQHLVSDIQAIAQTFKGEMNKLILGERSFSSDVPLRSRFGNILTKKIVGLLLGIQIKDTQTGLRYIPNKLIPHLLKIKHDRYEFELDMIITAHHKNFPIEGHPIQTVYLEGNKSSHFNPIIDSVKIYLVLFRFSIISLFSSILDTLLFALIHFFTANRLLSMVIARIIVGYINFNLNKEYVFHSEGSTRKEIIKYALLVSGLMLVAYSLLEVLVSFFHFKVIIAKIIAETILFISSFSIQHLLIFNNSKNSQDYQEEKEEKK